MKTSKKNSKVQVALASIAAAGITALTLSGCALGPNFERAAAPDVTGYVAADHLASAGGPGVEYGGEIAGEWYSLFHSDALRQLAHEALSNNPDLEAARHGLLAAQQELRAVSGARYPQIDALASVARAHANGSLLYEPANAFTATADLYSIGPTLSYRLDVFGGVRRAIESQAASTAYQHEQALNVYVSLVNQVVVTAFNYVSMRAQMDVTRCLVEDLQSQLELAAQLERSGKTTHSDVLQAQAQLANTRATLPELEQALAHYRNGLARLTGASPTQFQMPNLTLRDFSLPEQLPVSLPSDLVRQRPDILAAEDLLRQTCAEIGVAEAARFPSFTLSASYAQQTTRLNELFTRPGGVWSAGLDMAAPIFRGGELSARAKEARERYAQAEADYRGTVLTALVEVADGLEALHNDAASSAQHTAAVAANTANRDLAEAQFRAGKVTELEVLIAEEQYRGAALAQVRADAQRFADVAELFRALGGGWWNAPTDPLMLPTATSESAVSR